MKVYGCCNKGCNNESKLNFKAKRDNVVCSLCEVEKFLCQASKVVKGLKIYSLFKH